jgi:quercetin dioxygenase-like cupin family protein
MWLTCKRPSGQKGIDMTVVRTDEALPLRVLDDELRLMLRSDESPARMSVMVVEVPPGSGVPAHSHDVEEEGYFVLEGELCLTVGDAEHRLQAGDFGHVKPGVVHGYRNAGARRVRFLAWTIGGPIDRFFVEMSDRVTAMPRDLPVMLEVMGKYGVRPHGGPPGAG